jgi:hypothetical protein
VEIPTIEINLQPLFDELNSLKSEPKKYKHEFGSFLDAVKNGAYQAADALGIMNAAVGGGGGGTSTTKPQTFSEAGRGSAIPTMQSKGPDQIDTDTDNTIPGMKLRAFVPTNEQLAGIYEFTKRWQLAGEEINRAVEYALEDVAANMAEIIGQMGKGAAGMEAIGGMIFTTLGNLAQRVGKIAIGVAISIEGIKKALQSLNPAAAFAAGVALIALGAMVKKNLGGIGADNTPRLGRGGLATSPTTAIIGDNPSGKEAVIPFERMGEFLGMFQNQNQDQELYSHITNEGIFMSNKRGLNRNKRLT